MPGLAPGILFCGLRHSVPPRNIAPKALKPHGDSVAQLLGFREETLELRLNQWNGGGHQRLPCSATSFGHPEVVHQQCGPLINFLAPCSSFTRKLNSSIEAVKAHPVAFGVVATLAAMAVANRYLAKKAERENPPAGRFIAVNGVRLHYVDQGSGTPLVLLHGNGSMVQDFQSSGLIDLAAKKYRVIAFDRPGYGHSDRPRSTIWTPEAQADLIHAALTKDGRLTRHRPRTFVGNVSRRGSRAQIPTERSVFNIGVWILLSDLSSRCSGLIGPGYPGAWRCS